ncbi:MAG: flap endonuclease [Polyangiaceae bacterium]|nr:flap endonuclease [Myxococcales bacterium]MCB9588286.1 flap endonuclease [Polyangiaceae bacterium]
MQIHLIDGTYELFRAFYGAPSSTAGGREVGATRALLSNFANFVSSPDVTHVAVAFDHEIESFRNALFDGYKTGDGIDPDLFAQFPLAEEATRALGVVVWPMVEFEADDALAAGAARYSESPEVDRVVLCSPDKDLAQCVCDRVVCWDRLRDKWLDVDGVREKFGVAPESIPDYLALVGDAADGIPGIPKWGAKSAGVVLSEYLHLEHIPARFEDWSAKPRGAARLSSELEAAREAALLYRRLATLRRDVPLEETLDDLRWKGPDLKRLGALSELIGSDTVLRKMSAIVSAG